MSYLTYNGAMVESVGQYLVKNFYVIDWDGINDIVTLSGQPDLSGTKTITFNMWLTKDTGFASDMLFTLGLPPGNIFAELDSNIIRIGISANVNIGSTKTYSITGLTNQKLSCTIVKTTDAISSFTINGSPQSGGTGVSTRNTELSAIGGDGNLSSLLEDAYIWNIAVEGIGSWLGSGNNANTDAAWLDGIGSNNGTVVGSPTLKSLPVTS
jgi:hypothetical protein